MRRFSWQGMWRALIGMVAAMAMMVGLTPAGAVEPSFTDVTSATPHADDILWLASEGIAKGYGDGTFGGMRTVVRQDMAAFLYRLAGEPAYTPSAADKRRFKDVDEGSSHAKEVWWLASMGITTGYGDGTFGGMRTVVRQDMAAFLHRYALNVAGADDPDDDGVTLTDVTGKTPHGKDIIWLARAGVTTGWRNPDGKTAEFRGMNTVVRQDMAAFLHRMRLNVKPQGDGEVPVTGQAKDADGRPLANATLNVSWHTGNLYTTDMTDTDADGWFTTRIGRSAPGRVTGPGLEATVTVRSSRDTQVENITGSITLGRRIAAEGSSMTILPTTVTIDADDYTVSGEGDGAELTVTDDGISLREGDHAAFMPKGTFAGRAVTVETITKTARGRVINGRQISVDQVLDSLTLKPSSLDPAKATVTPAEGVTVADPAKASAAAPSASSSSSKAAPRKAAIGVEGTALDKVYTIDNELSMTSRDGGGEDFRQKIGYFLSKTELKLTLSANADIAFTDLGKSTLRLAAVNDFQSTQILCASYSNETGYKDTPCGQSEGADREHLINGGAAPDVAEDDGADAGQQDHRLDPVPLATVDWDVPNLPGVKVTVPISLVTHVSGHFRAYHTLEATARAEVTLADGKVTPTHDVTVDDVTDITAAAAVRDGISVAPTLQVFGQDLARLTAEPGLGLEAAGRLKVTDGQIAAAEASARFRFFFYIDAYYAVPLLSIARKFPSPISELGAYADDRPFGKNPLFEHTISEYHWATASVGENAARRLLAMAYGKKPDTDLFSERARIYAYDECAVKSVGDVKGLDQLGWDRDKTLQWSLAYHFWYLPSPYSGDLLAQTQYDPQLCSDLAKHGDAGGYQRRPTMFEANIRSADLDTSTGEWTVHAAPQWDMPGSTRVSTEVTLRLTLDDGGRIVTASAENWGVADYEPDTPAVRSTVTFVDTRDGTAKRMEADSGAPVEIVDWRMASLFGLTSDGMKGFYAVSTERNGGGIVIYAGGSYRADGKDMTFYLQFSDGTDPIPSTPVRTVASADGTTYAIDGTGGLWAWGDNRYGQVGDGTFDPFAVDGDRYRTTPYRVPGLPAIASVTLGIKRSGTTLVAVFALGEDGSLWVWGFGDLVADGTIGWCRSTPYRVPGLPKVRSVTVESDDRGRYDSSSYGVLAVGEDGSLWTWGSDASGDGTSTFRTTPYRVPGLPKVRSVIDAAGGTKRVLGEDGSLWVWGRNDYGQVGDGTTTTRLTPYHVPGLPKVKDVAADTYRTYALGEDGSLWAWGSNYSGQVGDGTTTDRLTPYRVQGLPAIGSIAYDDGCSTDDDGYHCASEGSVVFALGEDGSLWAWGRNDGRVGDGTTENRLTPYQVPGPSDVRKVVARYDDDAVYALCGDGSLWAWGNNRVGQVGDGTTEDRLTPYHVPGLPKVKDVMIYGRRENFGETVFALGENGSLWAWGDNLYGQVGDGTTTEYRTTPYQVQGLPAVEDVVSNGDTVLVLDGDGSLWAWGADWYGLVGDGDGDDKARLTPYQVQGLPRVGTVMLAGGTVYALGKVGSLWSWGRNGMGQVGDGTTTSRDNPHQVGFGS